VLWLNLIKVISDLVCVCAVIEAEEDAHWGFAADTFRLQLSWFPSGLRWRFMVLNWRKSSTTEIVRSVWCDVYFKACLFRGAKYDRREMNKDHCSWKVKEHLRKGVHSALLNKLWGWETIEERNGQREKKPYKVTGAEQHNTMAERQPVIFLTSLPPPPPPYFSWSSLFEFNISSHINFLFLDK